jgi:hypothetical protein
MLALLSDAELRYLGILAAQLCQRSAPPIQRMGAWQQLLGVFRARFEGISYGIIRATLLDCRATSCIFTDADDLISSMLEKERVDGQLSDAMEAAQPVQPALRLHPTDPSFTLEELCQPIRPGRPVRRPAERLDRPDRPEPTVAGMRGELLGLDRFMTKQAAPVTDSASDSASDSTSRFLDRQALDPQELEYFSSQDASARERIATDHLALLSTSSKPMRFQIIDSALPDRVKADVLRKYDAALRPGPHGGMMSTMDPKFQMWVDQVLQLPLGVYRPLPVDPADSAAVAELMAGMRRRLDATVSGQVCAKQALIEVVGACISNPRYAGGCVIGLCGEPGVGKTSLVREGLAAALNRPCVYVSLAGATEVAHLGGFCFTFEGSRPGAFAQGVVRSGCMNPIFLLDEADKCSQRGVADLLCTLTDSSNQAFVDKFFADIELDLSKAMYVFCYNDRDAIDPVLRDRICEIQMESFTPSEQVQIAADYLVPSLMRELRIDPERVRFAPAALQHLSSEYTPHTKGGVRPIRKVLQRLLMRLNVLLVARSAEPVGGGPGCAEVVAQLEADADADADLQVTTKLIDELLEATGQMPINRAPDMYM